MAVACMMPLTRCPKKEQWRGADIALVVALDDTLDAASEQCIFIAVVALDSKGTSSATQA